MHYAMHERYNENSFFHFFLTNLQPTVYDERRNKRKGEAISEKETWW